MTNYQKHLQSTEIYFNHNFKKQEYSSQKILSLEKLNKAKKEIITWNSYKETSLYELEDLADNLNINKIYFKDESTRFGLKSFKALGGAYAVANILINELKKNNINASSKDLISKKYLQYTKNITVTCATDGNHGKSVAWGANLFGCKCVIFIHESVSQNRKKEIEKYNAKVMQLQGNYDDAVRHASEEAKKEGHIVVSDTSYKGYTTIPKDVMQGYTIMTDEAIKQMDQKPSHIFLQGGVGGMAASVISVFHELYGESSPKFIIVEPNNANCLLQSAKNSKPTIVTGELHTMMAGLSCGEVSLIAWDIIKQSVSSFISIDDDSIAKTMKLLKNNSNSIIAGESAVAGLSAFLIVINNEQIKEKLEINENSNILFFGTEGNTDEEIYSKLVNQNFID